MGPMARRQRAAMTPAPCQLRLSMPTRVRPAAVRHAGRRRPVLLSDLAGRSGRRRVVAVKLRRWSRVQWLLAAAGAVAMALVVGVPTGLVATPFYTRMTPVPWWSYGVLVITAVLSGLLIATYVRRPSRSQAPSRAGVAANVGSLLAVGCPVCNKVVVAAAGVSGALNVWAPLQPLIAAASLVLLGWALRRRLVTPTTCPLPAVGIDADRDPDHRISIR